MLWLVSLRVTNGAALGRWNKSYDCIFYCLQVQEALDQQDGVIHPGIIVACFFVQEGADIHLTNKKGLTPLQICSESPPEIVAKVLEFAEKHTGLVTLNNAVIHNNMHELLVCVLCSPAQEPFMAVCTLPLPNLHLHLHLHLHLLLLILKLSKLR